MIESNHFAVLLQVSASANDVALDGGTQEEEDVARESIAAVRGARMAAARAWWKHKQAEHFHGIAQRELKQVRLLSAPTFVCRLEWCERFPGKPGIDLDGCHLRVVWDYFVRLC